MPAQMIDISEDGARGVGTGMRINLGLFHSVSLLPVYRMINC